MSKINDLVETQEAEATVNVSQSTLNSILAEIAELKKKQAKSEENQFEKAKEVYSGPLQAKYRMWGGVPILSGKWVKGKEEWELGFKNPATQERVDNHYIELTLADGTVLEGKNKLQNVFFAKFFERGPLTDFGVILKDGTELATINHKKLVAMQDEVESYTFETKERGKLIVDPRFIN